MNTNELLCLFVPVASFLKLISFILGGSTGSVEFGDFLVTGNKTIIKRA